MTNQVGVYDGEWVAGVKEGKGQFIAHSEGAVYTGQWKRNVYHGQGRFTSDTGPIKSYEGEWYQGRKNGKGTLVFYNGDSYEGFFKDDTVS